MIKIHEPLNTYQDELNYFTLPRSADVAGACHAFASACHYRCLPCHRFSSPLQPTPARSSLFFVAKGTKNLLIPGATAFEVLEHSRARTSSSTTKKSASATSVSSKNCLPRPPAVEVPCYARETDSELHCRPESSGRCGREPNERDTAMLTAHLSTPQLLAAPLRPLPDTL